MARRAPSSPEASPLTQVCEDPESGDACDFCIYRIIAEGVTSPGEETRSSPVRRTLAIAVEDREPKTGTGDRHG